MNAASARRYALLTFFALSSAVSFCWAQQKDTLGYQDTPIIPGTKWHVHDGLRPQPTVITPPSSDGKPVPAPSDATVLFDGKNMDNWRMGNNSPSNWKMEKDVMYPVGQDLFSKAEFGDCQLHVEWATPLKTDHNNQGRGNSGIWMQGRYEIQILDSYENQTYPDGQAGAVYGQVPPMVNASRKPGEWQTFDIFYTAPRFDGNTMKEPAYVTVLHNGVLVQNHTPILGDTAHRALAKYNGFVAKGPIKIQGDHSPTRFRNIWVRPLTPAQ